ncbi:DUF3237 domain-containing protein [Microbacterium sediminicola]|uniref:DUF3237 domain-containing protein n=2 Tax=Microbacterium sediminicola TaxID=415210 RepID=A0ABP4UA80_9MICO
MDYGQTRAGHRRIVPILGGALSAGLDAEVLPGGADWQIAHADGTLDIDTRYSARTTDGELVHIRTKGVRSGPPEVLEAILAGETRSPDEYHFRVVVTLETASARLRHLQDSIIVAAAAREASLVVYDAYRVL